MLQQNEVQRKKKRLYGFTLVELLVVMLVVGILMAIAIPSYFSVTADARKTNFCSSLAEIEKALQMYAVRHSGEYPDTISASTILTNDYFSKIPKNPYTNTTMIPDATFNETKAGSWTYERTDVFHYKITATPLCETSTTSGT